MKIESIQIKNYRCLKDVFIPFDDLSVLVGRNGTGKSCILQALNIFYNPEIKVEENDYYNIDTSQDISIIVNFTDLTTLEKKLFEPYLEGDKLSIENSINYSSSRPIAKYYAKYYRNPEFDAFRNSSGAGLREEYSKLRELDEYHDFPQYKNKDLAEEHLNQWELNNRDKCQRRKDDGQFFGFRNVGTSRMEKYTKFILIPAVQEASEEGIEKKGSIFEELMELVVKSALATNQDIIDLQTEAQKKYQEIIDPKKNKNLTNLSKKLTKNLQFFVPDSEVNIDWIEETGIQIVPPKAFVTLKEGGYESTVDRCGHGLQRAYIISLFQELGVIQASISLEETDTAKSNQLNLPSVIIGIEEPELYQHPDRQRYFAYTLWQLSGGGIEGTIENIQIIYSTHSPLMIDYLRFNQLRIFRKKSGEEENQPSQSQITYTNLAQVSRFIEKAKERSSLEISNESLRQRLIPLMNPWVNEGFFANLIVLVEGIKDRALILGEALSREFDFESKGICVIPCSGKDSMTEAIGIFKNLQIPTYVVWDSDEGSSEGISSNRNILRCHECEPEDYPSKITDDFCAIKTDLEKTFRTEIGKSNYERIISKYCKEKYLGKPSKVMENPFIVSELHSLFKAKNYESNVLKSIVNKIIQKYNSLVIV